MNVKKLVEAIEKPDETFERIRAASKGDGVVSKEDLQLLAAAFGGDSQTMLELLPAEAVPEEIRDAWRELRSVIPMHQKLETYIFS